jgi:predicted phosphodiesterase
VIAVLYDVHGNLPALEAVLADARVQGAERFVLGGDYALIGPGNAVEHRRVAYDHAAAVASEARPDE